MKISREAKKQEAIERMKLLKIYPQTIQQFEKQDYVSVSEPPFGAFFWVDDEQKEIIRRFEEEFDTLVYMGIMSYTSIGRMLSLLYVNDYEAEWESDRELMQDNIAIAYVYNYDMPDCSEAGYIRFRYTSGAGLLRTA